MLICALQHIDLVAWTIEKTDFWVISENLPGAWQFHAFVQPGKLGFSWAPRNTSHLLKRLKSFLSSYSLSHLPFQQHTNMLVLAELSRVTGIFSYVCLFPIASLERVVEDSYVTYLLCAIGNLT